MIEWVWEGSAPLGVNKFKFGVSKADINNGVNKKHLNPTINTLEFSHQHQISNSKILKR